MLPSPVLFEFCFHLESLASALFTVAATQYQTAGVWAAPGSKFLSLTREAGGRGEQMEALVEGGGFVWTQWGLCSLQRVRYLGKVELGVNRQILFVRGLRRVQNQACRDGMQTWLSLTSPFAICLDQTQIFNNITAFYYKATKGFDSINCYNGHNIRTR